MRIVDFLLDIIWPQRCPFCDKVIMWDKEYCKECFDKLKFIHNDNCPMCGQSPCKCKYKDGKRVYPYYDTCTSVVYYEDGPRNLIINLKFHNEFRLSKLCAKMIYDEIVENNYDNPLVIGVPMLKSKQRERGYNQANLIAKELAKLLKYDYSAKVLKKVRKTSSQKSLTQSQRGKNLLKAFAVKDKNSVVGREIILVDDVLTTGSTLNECAKTLKRAGAKRVDAVTFASTPFCS